MGNYFTQGLILRHINFRDADRLISIYTKERGLVNVVAKGSRKITSKLAGNLEPFILAEFMIIKGRKYDTVASSEVIDINREIKENLLKIKLASFFSNVILNTAKEMQRDNKLYDFILSVFAQIKVIKNKSNNTNWVVWYFIWQYLKIAGYQPELFKCTKCQSYIKQDKIFISFKKGGLLCTGCSADKSDLRPISISLIKILRLLSKSNLPYLYKVKINPSVAKEFIALTKGYFSYIFEIDINVPFFKLH